MSVVHRPDAELLLAYAVGRLPEPLSLLVATHLTLCPESRDEVATFEAAGGALLDAAEPAAVSTVTRDAVLANIHEVTMIEPRPTSETAGGSGDLPRPLQDYLGAPLDSLKWRARGTALHEYRLLPEHEGFRTRLLLIKAGKAMPQHTHVGSEMTLVLRGSFSDHLGHYARGDVAVADQTVDHTPVADEGEDCLCLAVSNAPVKLTGRLGRVLNPFIDF